MPDRRPNHQFEVAEAASERDLLLEKWFKMCKAEAAKEAAAAAAETHPQKPIARYRYPSMNENLGGNFRLHVAEGEIIDSQIIVVLGKQGTGKTTFLRMLAGTLEDRFNVSYKHQELIFPKNSTSLSLQQTVGCVLHRKIHDSCMNPEFVHNVMEPLHINLFMDKLVKDLSPGQLQSLALCLCLGKPADIYLIDEPSANILPVQRVAFAKVIKWFVRHEKKAAVVVEPDFSMTFNLARRYIVIEGLPFVDCFVNGPMSLLAGGNLYLSQLDDDEEEQEKVELLLDLRKLLESEHTAARSC